MLDQEREKSQVMEQNAYATPSKRSQSHSQVQLKESYVTPRSVRSWSTSTPFAKPFSTPGLNDSSKHDEPQKRTDAAKQPNQFGTFEEEFSPELDSETAYNTTLNESISLSLENVNCINYASVSAERDAQELQPITAHSDITANVSSCASCVSLIVIGAIYGIESLVYLGEFRSREI